MATTKFVPFKETKDHNLTVRINKDLVKKARELKIDVAQVVRNAIEHAVMLAEKKKTA